MSFLETFKNHSWSEWQSVIYNATEQDVQETIDRSSSHSFNLSLRDFATLLSPSALPFLETLCLKSRELTQKRFGKTISLYAPLYLSNECQNICTYCGFSYDNRIKRKTLTDEEIIEEAKAVRALGFEHVLLVSGEASRTVGIEYFQNALKLIKPYFSQVSLEVQPLSQTEYETLIAEGLHTVLVYQETYNKENYRNYHPKGKKSNFDFRLDTPDRLGRAGIHKIGLGALLGLEDWRVDSLFTAIHLLYLRKKYWRTKFSLSFPRLRPAEGTEERYKESHMSERELVQLIAAYRLFDENLELSLSTRESEQFRNHAVHLGVTSMSAESKTDPGGYSVNKKNANKKDTEGVLKQFSTSDERTAKEVMQMISQAGYEPVWKDWDESLMFSPVKSGVKSDPYRKTA